MVADNAVSLASLEGGPIHHIGHGPVMADEIKVHRGEIFRPVSEVSGNGQGLEEHLWQNHGRSGIDKYTFFKGGNHCGKDSKVEVGGRTAGGRIKIRVHVNDVGSQGHMDGDRNAESGTRCCQAFIPERHLFVVDEIPHSPAKTLFLFGRLFNRPAEQD